MSLNLVDSSGWLEYFADGPNAESFTGPIEDVEHLVVPTVCIAEVFRVLLRERGEGTAFLAISAMNQGRLLDLDLQLAMDAARMGMLHKLPLADSIVYAAAKAEQATLWTQDRHFEFLSGVEYVGKKI